jgi:hypothetical protein
VKEWHEPKDETKGEDMKLRDAIVMASNLAYEEDAGQIVGRIEGSWQIAHSEDLGLQAQMESPLFRVNSGGVDERQIGQITEDWDLIEEA